MLAAAARAAAPARAVAARAMAARAVASGALDAPLDVLIVGGGMVGLALAAELGE